MEIFDLYDKFRSKTGQTMVRGTKTPEGFYRVVVHVCIFNERNEMLIQLRQPSKHLWGGLWDISVGGAVQSGETSAEGAEREVLEEIGLKTELHNLRPSLSLSFNEGFDDIYIISESSDTVFKLQESEVADVKWATLDEIIAMHKSGEFIPYSEEFIRLLFTRQKGRDLS